MKIRIASKKFFLILPALLLVFAALPFRLGTGEVSGAVLAEERVVYLTFDDGPGTKVTPRVLDILKEERIPATFFVLGSEADKNPQMLRRIYEEGHRIANHSYGHDYEYLYADPANLAADIRKAEDSINRALGIDYGSRAFRFPGGSSQREQRFRDVVTDMGYRYYGWNSSGEDSVLPEGSTAEEILNNVISTAGEQKEVIVLLHDNDAKGTTADALPEIIKYFREKGYQFRSIE